MIAGQEGRETGEEEQEQRNAEKVKGKQQNQAERVARGGELGSRRQPVQEGWNGPAQRKVHGARGKAGSPTGSGGSGLAGNRRALAVRGGASVYSL